MICQDLCGEYVMPCCDCYDQARQIFNRSIQKYPSVVVYCENTEEAARAVCWAREEGCTIRLRSGGHNYEGYCIGDKVVVIDTSCLKEMKLDESAGIICIGSGVSNKELYSLLGRHGYPFASGTCPTVHAVGLTQGGGWGHSARMLGLTCDSLLEAELIDAAGNCLIINDRCHPDLFWALRGGGGGNFGVITSLKYKLPSKVSNVTYIDVEYSAVSEETALNFFRTWQCWLREDDISFTPNSRITQRGTGGLNIFLRGFYYGTPEEARLSVQPFLNIPGAKGSFRFVTFLEATEIDAAVYPDSEKFRFAGRFTQQDFTDCQMNELISLIREKAEGATSASIALYALGGKAGEVAVCDTAFFYRNADYIIGLETIWEENAAMPDNLKWFASRFPCLQSVTAGSYINFPYLGTEGYMQAYYGDHAYRLMDIKAEYDPCELFSFPQSITTPSCASCLI